MISKRDEQKQETRDAMRGGSGSVRIKHFITKDAFEANVRLCAELTIPPGAGIGEHDHKAEDEVYIIVAGKAIITDDGVEKEVVVGDAILTGKGASHAIRNDGDEELKLIAVIMEY